jgi:hypothetical protein
MRLSILNMFNDVNLWDWFFIDVNYVYSKGIFRGLTENTFGPDAPMTRGMIVTTLYRAHGSPKADDLTNPFIDVDSSEYYYIPVIWAAANGIIKGNYDGGFMPDEYVTRQQLAAIIYRYAAFIGKPFPREAAEDIPGVLIYLLQHWYKDTSDIYEYAWAPVLSLTKKGIMRGGLGDLFRPEDYGTRAEAAAILRRFMSQ